MFMLWVYGLLFIFLGLRLKYIFSRRFNLWVYSLGFSVLSFGFSVYHMNLGLDLEFKVFIL